MTGVARANMAADDPAHWRDDITLLLARTMAVLMLLPELALLTTRLGEGRPLAAVISLGLYTLLVAAAVHPRLTTGLRVTFLLIVLAGIAFNIILMRGLRLNVGVLAGTFVLLVLFAWGRAAAVAGLAVWVAVLTVAGIAVANRSLEMTPEQGAGSVLMTIAGWIALTAMVTVALSSVIERLEKGVAQAANLEARLRDEAAARLEVAQRLLSHEEALRGNLARELHDDIGQRLTAIKITLETARVRRQDTLAAASREAIRLMHELGRDMSMSTNLRPALIDQGGISRAIRTLVRDETVRAGLTADVDVPDGLPIRDNAQIPCYRIVQEALTNSIRHARARSIIVRGARIANGVTLIVRDDGVGFDVEAARRLGRAGERLGVVGMRERAEGIGAEFDIVSSPGRGTEVRLVVPDEEVA